MGVVKLVVLASGRGSNFNAIAEAVEKKTIPNTTILALITNRKDAEVIKIAEKRNVQVKIVDSSLFKTGGKLDRATYEAALEKTLSEIDFDFLCLAGYLLILGPRIVSKYPGKILNIHPSLLPAFRGLHAQKQALEAKVKKTGCTVHFVVNELDAGPIVAQSALDIMPNDTLETLTARLLPLEHETYVRALKELAQKGK